MKLKWVLLGAAFAIGMALPPVRVHAQDKLLNVSYDATREFYTEYDKGFEGYWKQKTGRDVQVEQSYGGSGNQTRAVLSGLEADVVTLSFPADIDQLQQGGLVQPGWRSKLAFDSSPYTSTIVFVVRTGNPKGIKDWPDLVKPGVDIIAANPKTGGGARWNYLAAWGYALKKYGSDAAARDYVTKLYNNVSILTPGARGATTAFVDQGQGDVLIAWENEALLIQNKLGHGQYQVVYPSISILAEAPVAVVDKNVDAHGTRELATDYLDGLYSRQAQALAVKYYFRPRIRKGIISELSSLPKINTFTIGLFGGWAQAQKTHFADGGVFDQITAKK